jgi:hypothetical protein
MRVERPAPNVTLYLADCCEVLPSLSSIHSCVCDPPYGLSFMGREWDHAVPSPDVWRLVLAALRPGAHLLSFAGTRTQHRMASAIEDAGFEVRDMIAWVYGSGFPKSRDVSKAIDMGTGENRERQLKFTAWMRSTGISAATIRDVTRSCMASHYLTDREQPAIATADMFDKLRPYLPEVPEYIERLVAERTGIEWTDYVKREVVGLQKNAMSGWNMDGTTKFADRDITAPATEAACAWSGWGTALKPAMEPITVARKPLVGTVAANVLEHGTGAINVDACRVGSGAKMWTSPRGGIWATDPTAKAEMVDSPVGRWPANLIHDGSDEVTRLFPVKGPTALPGGPSRGKPAPDAPSGIAFKHMQPPAVPRHDEGSLARFFYCPKVSPSERDGCSHPTMKPVDLMRYLVRLVTPIGGIVLDPFVGSGSTGIAAIRELCGFIGIERDPVSFENALRRIESALRQPSLFGEVA